MAGHAMLRLVRPPSHSRRADAARHWARRSLMWTAGVGAIVIALMYVFDALEIALMPPRGTASLWPVRILTDFGKSAYVLWVLAGLNIIVLLALPAASARWRLRLMGYGTRLQFIFLAVLMSVVVNELIKGIVGRGRPFVGGAANPFNFSHFAWSEAYASFPSGHATTAFALAFAVASVWPHLRLLMLAYAVAIALSRLVLLAHHPSDVVAGALVGTIGAMAVRYWFAARRLAFTIRQDGTVVPLMGPSRRPI